MEYGDLSFNDDILERKQFVTNTMRIIDEWDKLEHENKSLVLAIDSPWGTGKSYLLNIWKNWLLSEEQADKNYAVAYYNAWEEDDSENAFVPLIYRLQQLEIYSENKKLAEVIAKKSKSFLESCAIALVKDGVKKVIGEETAKIITSGIDGAEKAKTDYFFKKYETIIKEKNKFKEVLKDFVPEDGKLIVLIDELDRCRPNFAIETLEIIKHYFNINNIVFIFAVDLEQLAHSISTMYGIGMDSAGYLRRFFDFNIKIPLGDTKKYVGHILKSAINNINFPQYSIDTIVNIYNKLNLSLRDMNKVTNNFLIFYLYYKEYFDQEKVNSQLIKNRIDVYLYFMTMKYKFTDVYDMILHQDYMAYDNAPKNRPELEFKYFISPYVSGMLKDMQTGKAMRKDNDLITKYGITDINGENTFAEHIEKTIEMFT